MPRDNEADTKADDALIDANQDDIEATRELLRQLGAG